MDNSRMTSDDQNEVDNLTLEEIGLKKTLIEEIETELQIEKKLENQPIKLEFEAEKDKDKFWLVFSEGIKGTLYNIKHFFTNPKKSIKWLFSQKVFVVYFIAIISGLVGAAAAWLFGNFIALIRILLYGVIFNATNIYWRFLLILIFPTIAAALMTPMVNKWSPESKGHGIPEVMESIIYKDGYIKTSTPYVKMFSAGVNIGAGLSLGSEGPIAQTGAGLSSFLGRKLGLRGRNIKTVVVCGLVAGISATFNAPIGGLLFGIEILIISLSADQLIPMLISSLIATTIGRIILEKGYHPIFEVPQEIRDITFNDYLPYLHWFVLLGVVTGLMAVAYVKSVGIVEQFSIRAKLHPLVFPIAGAFLTGLIGIISPKGDNQIIEFKPFGANVNIGFDLEVSGIPRIFGNGYDTITALFANKPVEDSWDFLGSKIIVVLFLIIALKILATAFSVGTGNSGGVFAPALFVGAATGYSFALIINNLPGLNLQSRDFALFTLVGLAAVFAGSSRAILTMIFMASELTSSYYAFIPLMISCSITYFICKATMRDSIYTMKLRQKGLNISMAGPTDLIQTHKVKDIMTSNVICVPEHMKMTEFYNLVQNMEYFGYPIIDFNGKYLGMVTALHLKLARLNNEMEKTVLEIGEKDPYVLYPEETVEHAISMLYRSQIGRLAVLDAPEKKHLIGIVSQTDILKCLETQKIKDLQERQRAELELIKAELRMVEDAIGDHPELKEKVRVVKSKDKLWEKDLVEYLREKAEEVPLERPEEHPIAPPKPKKSKKKKKKSKNDSTQK